MTLAPLSDAAWTSFAKYLITTGASSSLAWFAEIDRKKLPFHDW